MIIIGYRLVTGSKYGMNGETVTNGFVRYEYKLDPLSCDKNEKDGKKNIKITITVL